MLFLALSSPLAIAKTYQYRRIVTSPTPTQKYYYYQRKANPTPSPTPSPTPRKKTWYIAGATTGSAVIGASYSGPIGWTVLGCAAVLTGLGYLAYRIYYRVRYGKQDYMEKQCRYWKAKFRELEKSFKTLRKYKNQMSSSQWAKQYERLLREQQKIFEKMHRYCKKTKIKVWTT